MILRRNIPEGRNFSRDVSSDREKGGKPPAGKEGKKMKKIIALVLATVLICAASAAAAEGPMTGGWTPSADPAVTEERNAVFAKGTETLTGMDYVPLVYLGSQVVAGTNHAFLCQAATAYPGTEGIEAVPAYAIVYLYEDLQGNVSILNIANLDVGALCTYGAE